MSDLDDLMIELDEENENLVVIEVDEAAPEYDGTTLVFLRPEQQDALIISFVMDEQGVAATVEAFLGGAQVKSETITAVRP